jgi:hypothetical protein
MGLSGVGLAFGVGLALGEIVSTGAVAGEVDGTGLATSELVEVSEAEDAKPRKIIPMIIIACCQNFRALNLFNKFLSILAESYSPTLLTPYSASDLVNPENSNCAIKLTRENALDLK